MIQARNDAINARNGISIASAQIAFGAHIGNDNQLVAHMVKDDQVIGHQQHHVRHIERAGGGGGQPLHKAHQIIAKITDHAAIKTGQPRHLYRVATGHQLLDNRQRVTLHSLQHGAARAADYHLITQRRHGHRRIDADKAIAANLFAPLDRFEEKAGRSRRLLG